MNIHFIWFENQIEKIDDDTWVGFCAYRRFWSEKFDATEIKSKKDFLKNVPDTWQGSDVILK